MPGLEKSPPRLEFLLDIDYIFKWVPPRKHGRHFEFWLSPATLVFENVFELLMDIHADQPEWEIDSLTCDLKTTSSGIDSWLWTLDLHQGRIRFWSTGFKQYIRKLPALYEFQFIPLDKRGGVSFEKTIDGTKAGPT